MKSRRVVLVVAFSWVIVSCFSRTSNAGDPPHAGYSLPVNFVVKLLRTYGELRIDPPNPPHYRYRSTQEPSPTLNGHLL